jgi:hypothetical protein
VRWACGRVALHSRAVDMEVVIDVAAAIGQLASAMLAVPAAVIALRLQDRKERFGCVGDLGVH